MTELTPKTNPHLFGHEAAEARWLADVESGKLAHGWIISGPKGIGKATLAYRIARMMLAGNKSAAQRIATGAHADFLVIEPEFDDKKGEQKNNISVEQARGIGQFLSLTPAESAWRVVIVDSVDQLNPAGANSILKILEEPPPQALLLLISHNPGSLLPTIRSRCAMLKLAPLADADFTKTMTELYPEMGPSTLTALKIFSGGSPGLAAHYEGQGALALYDQMLDVLALPALDTLKAHAFADQFAGGGAHAQFKLFSELALSLFARVCKSASGLNQEAVPNEGTVLTKLAALHSPVVWAAKWQQAQEQFSLAVARHLDYKQVVIVFFHSIANPEPFSLGAAA
jgi:DNA polymerase III subunit delta'